MEADDSEFRERLIGLRFQRDELANEIADRQKLDQMIIYSQTAMCRWRKLLNYFDGEATLEACGHCDRCEAAADRTA